MKPHLIRGVGLALAMTLLSMLIEAQRQRPNTRPEEPKEANACSANGISCLFGSAAGCSASCTSGRPVCIGARCFLGFPIASECTCEGITP